MYKFYLSSCLFPPLFNFSTVSLEIQYVPVQPGGQPSLNFILVFIGSMASKIELQSLLKLAAKTFTSETLGRLECNVNSEENLETESSLRKWEVTEQALVWRIMMKNRVKYDTQVI